MLPFNSQSGNATDLDIRKVRDAILVFLQRHPNDVEALNEALLPFTYLTILRPVPGDASGIKSAEVLDGIPQGQVEFGMNAAWEANIGDDTDSSSGTDTNVAEAVAFGQGGKRRSVKQGNRIKFGKLNRPSESTWQKRQVRADDSATSTSTDALEIPISTQASDSACCDFLAPHDDTVSQWVNDPEIKGYLQRGALAKYELPQLELKSYLNIVASIGTMEVQRAFAVGVMQLLRSSTFSFKVPISPDHLLNVEDAATLQCFWRAAYRAQDNGLLAAFGVILHRRSLISLRNCYFKAMEVIKNTMKRKGVPGFTKAAIARSILIETVFPGGDKDALKKMSDRLKNDVTRARNYCKLVDYYGSSGILGLLPQALTDTRMRDFTDAEFELFLDLLKRLRPDLENERLAQVGEIQEVSRMRVWGRVIDMAHAGLPLTQTDCRFIQEETHIILTEGHTLESSDESVVAANPDASGIGIAGETESLVGLPTTHYRGRPILGGCCLPRNYSGSRAQEDLN